MSMEVLLWWMMNICDDKQVTYTPVMLLQDYSIISEDGQVGADHLLGLHWCQKLSSSSWWWCQWSSTLCQWWRVRASPLGCAMKGHASRGHPRAWSGCLDEQQWICPLCWHLAGPPILWTLGAPKREHSEVDALFRTRTTHYLKLTLVLQHSICLHNHSFCCQMSENRYIHHRRR